MCGKQPPGPDAIPYSTVGDKDGGRKAIWLWHHQVTDGDGKSADHFTYLCQELRVSFVFLICFLLFFCWFCVDMVSMGGVQWNSYFSRIFFVFF